MPTDTRPIKLATIPFETLQNQQWDLALLGIAGLSRPLTVEEVSEHVAKLRQVLLDAAISWQNG